MSLIYREYGDTIEITTIEKTPSKIRLFSSRSKRTVYGARRSDSLRRARQICLRRLSTALKKFGSPLLLTLTLSGDASDAAFASSALGRFQVRLCRRYLGCQSLFVPELSPRGRIHFHGLVFNLPLSFGDIRRGGRLISYGTERDSRELASLWGAGFLDCVQTDGSQRLASYLSKYITKSSDSPLFNAMHLIRISQGFPKEFVARDEYAQYFIDKMPDDILPKYVWVGDNDYLGTIEKKWYF